MDVIHRENLLGAGLLASRTHELAELLVLTSCTIVLASGGIVLVIAAAVPQHIIVQRNPALQERHCVAQPPMPKAPNCRQPSVRLSSPAQLA